MLLEFIAFRSAPGEKRERRQRERNEKDRKKEEGSKRRWLGRILKREK